MKQGLRKTGCYIQGTLDGFEGSLTPNEGVILSFLPMKWKYITRDNDRRLCIWTKKPYKETKRNHWMGESGDVIFFPYTSLFKMVKWADNQPTNIDELLRSI